MIAKFLRETEKLAVNECPERSLMSNYSHIYIEQGSI